MVLCVFRKTFLSYDVSGEGKRGLWREKDLEDKEGREEGKYVAGKGQ